MAHGFSDRDLRGCSFRGADLTGANFFRSDIRGADFTNATLTGANFCQAKAGLQPSQAMRLVFIAIVLSALLGLTAIFAIVFFGCVLFPLAVTPRKILSATLVSELFAVYILFNIPHNLRAALGTIAATGAILGVIFGLTTGNFVGVSAGIVAAGIAVGVCTVAIAVSIIAATISEMMYGVIAVFAIVCATIASAILGSVLGVILGIPVVRFLRNDAILSLPKAEALSGTLIASTFGIAAGAMIVRYIVRQILAEDKTFGWMRKIAIAVLVRWGTSFKGADLTHADFAHATLKNTDFTNATLTRTHFHLAQHLETAKVDNTILSDPHVRNVVVTKRVAKESFAGCNLKGANLLGADLRNADFTEADLSEATLEYANLEGANLTKTKAIKADFRQAKLTGVCLEAWKIDKTTQLKEAICDYVYLTQKQLKRYPLYRKFVSEEFSLWVKQKIDEGRLR
ncbi:MULTISPECIES: pentapeptide repeat-containing protein [Nostocales]|uniref:Pentapeptide repeat-containing protein n=3 Tax=Nostocales TaxID=1161 RepID=A0A8S9TDP0_9CYAN|nr:pentapeptide repeat-containing protein [Tolypothrix bouteillei]KAF3890097.1 pentapeptide repeat-containing protein [Tolypothrix bouteillei VB521301]